MNDASGSSTTPLRGLPPDVKSVSTLLRACAEREACERAAQRTIGTTNSDTHPLNDSVSENRPANAAPVNSSTARSCVC